ncbi:MAG: molybdenum cofactor guanylyltransferase MobA [Janthinobacterium lividum]
MTTAGVILAGGRATRMGGGDKCRLVVDGRPIIDRIRAVILPQVAALALNANGDPARFDDLALPVLPDPLPGQPGPLAGILAGLDWAAAAGHAWLLSVPGDTPFLPPDLVARLHAARGTQRYACAQSGDQLHPIVALWSTGCRDALRTALHDGLRKVQTFTRQTFASQAVAHWPAAPADPFRNLNSPADLLSVSPLDQRLQEPVDRAP